MQSDVPSFLRVLATIAVMLPCGLAIDCAGVTDASNRACDAAVSISLSPADTTVFVGDTVRFRTSVTDGGFNALSCSVSWTGTTSSFRVLDHDQFVPTTPGTYFLEADAGATKSKTARIKVFSATVYAPRRYDVLDLTTTLPAGATVMQLLEDGSVAGTFNGAGYLWQQNVMTRLVGCPSLLHVNHRGTVLCVDSVPIVWQGGSVTRIHELENVTPIRSVSLDDAGVVVGSYIAPRCGYCEFEYQDGVFRDLITLSYPFGAWSNDHGDRRFLGYSFDDGNYQYLIKYTDGHTDSFGIASWPDALVMSDSGWIAGPVALLPAQRPTDSALPIECSSVIAFVRKNGASTFFGPGTVGGVNNHGQVVGRLQQRGTCDFGHGSTTAAYPPLTGAFLWANGSMQLLTRAATDPRWTIQTIGAINDAGQLLGVADDSAGGRFNHTLLLTLHP